MKPYMIRLVAVVSALPVSGSAMAHGGHDDTASTVIHTLYHLVVGNRLPVLLAVGTLLVVVFGRAGVVDAVRRIIERK